MSQFYGMDPEVVGRVGMQLQHAGDHLDGIAQRIEQILQRIPGVWEGRDAADFQSWWHQQHRPALRAAAESVRGLGTSAVNNAREQVAVAGASGHSAGGGFGAIGGAAGTAGPGGSGTGWLDAAGLLHGATDIFVADGATGSALSIFKGVGTVLNGVGLGFSVVQIVEGAQAGEIDSMFMGGVGVAGTGVAVIGGAAAAPLAFGIGAFSGLVNYSIPVGGDAQDSLLNWQAERMFGAGTDEMTPSQAQRLVERYDGWDGPLWMISDKMDQSADQIGDAVGGIASSVSKTVGGWFR